ncbi:hypothetical protein [Candidatus Uabimicrobium sp. HlEnr_7]|uniref:hypothetical protein n=1 Tax=Candidatus Uabimicrobium helgolandensis TaxID=3095367 RepID=UPI003557A66B
MQDEIGGDFNFEDFQYFLSHMEREAKPIPQILYSVYSGAPFSNCVSCERHLQESPILYQVQKVFRKKRVIFEYSLCFECQQGLAKEYSQESTEKLQNFFLENYVMTEDMHECHLCQSQEVEKEHTLLALCLGEKLLFSSTICGLCTEKMQGLLSEQTRKTMGDFIQENFPGVPEELAPAPVFKI